MGCFTSKPVVEPGNFPKSPKRGSLAAGTTANGSTHTKPPISTEGVRDGQQNESAFMSKIPVRARSTTPTPTPVRPSRGITHPSSTSLAANSSTSSLQGNRHLHSRVPVMAHRRHSSVGTIDVTSLRSATPTKDDPFGSLRMGTSESRTRIPMRRSSEASRSPTTPTTVTPITPASTTPANAFGASDKAARRRSAIVPLGGLTPVKDSDKSYSVDAELSRVESEVQETPTKAPVQSSVLSGLQRNRSPSVATQGGESIIRANTNPRNEPSITTDISSTPTSSSIISPHTRTTTMTSEAPPSVGSSLIPVHNSRHASRMVEVTDLTSRLQIRKDLTHRSGGFSDVFQGDLSVDGASAQRVAVKVIRPVNMNVKSEDFKSRFERRVRRESYVWSLCNHPRISPLLGFASHNGLPCLVSPWCHNGNAKEYLSKRSNVDRKLLVRQVAEGLLYLHTHKTAIVHADIKPENVLINDKGEAMLCDFGVARVYEEDRSEVTAAAFTLRYTAPEVLAGRPDTPSTDVYSFGCLSLEMVLNKVPFSDFQNGLAVMGAKQRGVSPLPRSFEVSDSDHFWMLMEKCWCLDPGERLPIQAVVSRLIEIGS